MPAPISPARIAITAGEPAGIGPELVVQLAQQQYLAELVAIADPALLEQRAQMLGLPLAIEPCSSEQLQQPASPLPAGRLRVLATPLATPSTAGRLNTDNAAYVLKSLQLAVDHCLAGHCQAMVTAPVHKAVINNAGIPFSGHTEFLAAATGSKQVVMLLATEGLRVALLTTHLPLADVPAQITDTRLRNVLKVLESDLQRYFGLQRPRIAVLGLNPHAGEGGHMGREEIDTIIPCLQQLRSTGMQLQGPLPADTAFTARQLQNCDVVLAMYHDQGLPVLKYKGFGRAANITLGLPIIRSSVDHGTALELAGSGQADLGSLETALKVAIEMASHRHRNTQKDPQHGR